MVRRSAINSNYFTARASSISFWPLGALWQTARKSFSLPPRASRIVRITEGDDLGLVVFESLDRFLIDRVGLAFEVRLSLFARGDDDVLLLFC